MAAKLVADQALALLPVTARICKSVTNKENRAENAEAINEIDRSIVRQSS